MSIHALSLVAVLADDVFVFVFLSMGGTLQCLVMF